MRFIINSQLLLKTLQSIGGVITPNSTLPILNCFLFSLNGQTLTIRSTDTETTMVVKLELTEVSEEGEVAVPSKMILDALKTFADLPLVFSVDPSTHAIDISAGDGKYKMVGESAEFFPAAPHIDSVAQTEIPMSVLAKAIQMTAFATGVDDMRPVMSGVFFELSEESLMFVATDAHKLVRYSRKDAKSDQAASFIIHRKTLNQVKTLLNPRDEESNVRIAFNDRNAYLTFENYEVICRLIEGKYPNYRAVIPADNPNELIIDRQSLLSSIRRVGIFSNQSSPQARFTITGSELIISSQDLESANEAKERLVCEYKGDAIEIGFSTKYLIEMLSNLESEQVKINLSIPSRPGLIRPVQEGQESSEDVLMLVMPILINA